jgi:hypothetical protein
MKDMEEINKLIEELTNMPPLTEYKEPMNDINHAMNYGLAQMYGNKGFREYMQNQINIATKASALKSKDIEDVNFGKGRILTLKELLVKARRAFETFEKINLLKARNQSLKVEATNKETPNN